MRRGRLRDRVQPRCRAGDGAGRRRVVLAWDAPTVRGEATELAAHSFAILRLSREQT